MRVSRWLVPLLVALAAAAGIWGARLFAAPSYAQEYAAASAHRPETVQFIVRGLKCVDTARTVARQLEETPGVLRFVAYASRNEAQVTYDASLTDPQILKDAIEGPIFSDLSGEILFNQYEVLSIDGNKIR